MAAVGEAACDTGVSVLRRVHGLADRVAAEGMVGCLMPYSAHQSRGGEIVVLFNGWCEVRRFGGENKVAAAQMMVDTYNDMLDAEPVNWERWKHTVQRKRREIAADER
jgi:hypothetical protein